LICCGAAGDKSGIRNLAKPFLACFFKTLPSDTQSKKQSEEKAVADYRL
jgi:hypothetical protein